MKKQRLHTNNCTWTCWKAASVCGLSTLAQKIYPPRKSKHKTVMEWLKQETLFTFYDAAVNDPPQTLQTFMDPILF